MSTAAPTAPAPASAQGPAAGTPAGEAPAPGSTVAPAGEPKAAKPIKPIPRLPGVLEDGPENATTRPVERARDASGKFVAGEPSPDAGVRKPKPTALDATDGFPEPPPEAPVKPEPFEVAGEKFESREKFEQSYKSLKGMYKPLADIGRQLGGLDKIAPKYLESAASARGWHAEAQRLSARVAELEGGATAAPAQPQSEPAPAATPIDWELFAEISKVANEAGTPWKAQQWLAEQNAALVQAEIARIREDAIDRPAREAQSRAEVESTADALGAAMAAHRNPDGSPAFPEFQGDGEQAAEVGALWRSFGLPAELALSEGGIIAAVALYRMAKLMNAPSPVTPPADPTPAPQPAPARDLAAEAAAALEGGRPLMPGGGDMRHTDPVSARLLAGLKNRELTRSGLGFEA